MGIQWRNLVFKIVETMLYLVTSILVGVYAGSHGFMPYFIIIGLTSYFWMVVVLIFAIIIAKPVHKVLNLLFCLVFAVYGIIGGALAIVSCRNIFKGMVSEDTKLCVDVLYMTGLLAICLAAIYIVDGFSDLCEEVRPGGRSER